MNKILSVRTVHKGWSTFAIATIRLASGETVKREIEDHGRAVSVLPFDASRKMAMVIRQFRPPVLLAAQQATLLEAIAGIAENEPPDASARREASEEAGLTLTELEHVGCVWPMPGVSTERLDLFLAPYTEAGRTGTGGGLAQEHEDIAVLEMRLAELAGLADAGRLDDMKLMLLVQTLRLRRPELFRLDDGAASRKSRGVVQTVKRARRRAS